MTRINPKCKKLLKVFEKKKILTKKLVLKIHFYISSRI